MTNKKLIGIRDPFGIRPLVLGKLNSSYILASETCALDIIGAKYIRDVENGGFEFGSRGMFVEFFYLPGSYSALPGNGFEQLPARFGAFTYEVGEFAQGLQEVTGKGYARIFAQRSGYEEKFAVCFHVYGFKIGTKVKK